MQEIKLEDIDALMQSQEEKTGGEEMEGKDKERGGS
jgi:hypothetical protein